MGHFVRRVDGIPVNSNAGSVARCRMAEFSFAQDMLFFHEICTFRRAVHGYPDAQTE